LINKHVVRHEIWERKCHDCGEVFYKSSVATYCAVKVRENTDRQIAEYKEHKRQKEEAKLARENAERLERRYKLEEERLAQERRIEAHRKKLYENMSSREILASEMVKSYTDRREPYTYRITPSFTHLTSTFNHSQIKEFVDRNMKYNMEGDVDCRGCNGSFIVVDMGIEFGPLMRLCGCYQKKLKVARRPNDFIDTGVGSKISRSC